MKRFFVLTAALAMLALTAASALAVPRWIIDPVMWRSTGTTTNRPCGTWTDYNSGQPIGIGFCDSTYRFHGEGIAGAYKADTTQPIYTNNWTLPPQFAKGITGVGSAADTTVYGQFYVNQMTSILSGSPAAASDSFYIAVQASFDNILWTTLSATGSNQGAPFRASGGPAALQATHLQTRLSSTTNGGTYFPLSLLHPGAGQMDFPQAATAGNLVVADLGIAHWPIIRFIVISASAGAFQPMIGHWVEQGEVPVKDELSVPFRSTGSPSSFPCGLQATGIGYCDSLFSNNSGGKSDTTAPVSMNGWMTIRPYATIDSVHTDSMLVGGIRFIPDLVPVGSNQIGVGSGTFPLSAQVSQDGINWIAISNVTVSTVYLGSPAVSYFPLRWSNPTLTGIRPPLAGTAPSIAQLQFWPYIRFIASLTGGGTDLSGEHRCKVQYFKPVKF